jgi:hypothetical protein
MTHPLFKLLSRLDAARYHYSMSRHRADTVLVTVTFVGERVEVDVFEDGHMEVSRFPGSEDIVGGEDFILALIKENQAKDV